MLPTNRQIKTLGEVLDVIRNGKSCAQNKNKEGDKITRIETISEGVINTERVGYFLLDEEDKEKYKIYKGDILFSHINSPVHIGKIAIAEKDYDDLFHGMNLLLLRGNKKIINSQYLFSVLNWYFLRGDRERICNKAINQASLNQKVILEAKIPLPPLSTQQAIVAKLDQIHAEISANQLAIHQQLAQLDELWQSSLDQIFSNEEWEKVKLEELIKERNLGLVRNLKEQGMDKKYNYIKMNNISLEGYLSLDDTTKVDCSLEEIQKFGLKKGDFLFNTRNSFELVGKSAIFSVSDGSTYVYNNNILRLRFIKKVLSEFVNYYWISTNCINQLNKIKSGTTNVSAIYYKNLKDIKAPLPDLATQKAAVAKLDQIHEHITQLRADYTAQLAQYEELRASVLDQAFKGQLVE